MAFFKFNFVDASEHKAEPSRPEEVSPTWREHVKALKATLKELSKHLAVDRDNNSSPKYIKTDRSKIISPIYKEKYSLEVERQLCEIVQIATNEIYRLVSIVPEVLDKLERLYIDVMAGEQPIAKLMPFNEGGGQDSGVAYSNSLTPNNLARLTNHYNQLRSARLSGDPKQVEDALRMIRVNKVTFKDIAGTLPDSDHARAITAYVDVFLKSRNMLLMGILPFISYCATQVAKKHGDHSFDDYFQLFTIITMNAIENYKGLKGSSVVTYAKHAIFGKVQRNLKAAHNWNGRMADCNCLEDPDGVGPEAGLEYLVSKNKLLPGSTISPEDFLLSEEPFIALEESMSSLVCNKPQWFEPMNRYFFSGVSYQDMAKERGKSRSAVQQLADKGIRWLEVKMTEMGVEP